MNLDPLYLMLSILFGAVGIFYLGWGKRSQQGAIRLGGLLLLIYPFFVERTGWLIAVGLVLIIAPLLYQRFY